MVQITVELDTSGIGKLGSMPREATPKALSYAAQDMTRFLQQNTSNGKPRVRHGLLKSWFIDSLSDTEAHIKSPASYAIYQDQGTDAHMIYPKGIATYHAGRKLTSGSALWWPGAPHPVRAVKHPGFPGNFFVQKSFEELEPRVPGYFLKAFEEVQG